MIGRKDVLMMIALGDDKPVTFPSESDIMETDHCHPEPPPHRIDQSLLNSVG